MVHDFGEILPDNNAVSIFSRRELYREIGTGLALDDLLIVPQYSEIKSINDIKKVLEPLTIPPTKEEDPDFYLDYGSDTSYHTKTGKGECAA